jgi:dTDP-4-dehydrorhamnose reductase
MEGDMVSTILLLGVNGQLGHELRRTLEPMGKVVALGRSDADFCDPESLRDVVHQVEPSILVNAAAYTSVDKAESEPDLALTVNAIAPGILAEEAEKLGACFVHYSTDFVFDGGQDHPYSEDMETNPLSAYGRSKLAGELAVASACSRHLIFRTSWVFGNHGSNFLKTMLRIAADRDSLNVVEDQTGTPSAAALIAKTTATILRTMELAPAADKRWGTYHLTASGETSWFAYAKYVIEQARAKGLKLKASGDSILPIKTAEYPLPAIRPTNSVLNTTKISETFGLTMPCWKTGVDQVISHMVGN